jgi:hypothetical protein
MELYHQIHITKGIIQRVGGIVVVKVAYSRRYVDSQSKVIYNKDNSVVEYCEYSWMSLSLRE